CSPYIMLRPNSLKNGMDFSRSLTWNGPLGAIMPIVSPFSRCSGRIMFIVQYLLSSNGIIPSRKMEGMVHINLSYTNRPLFPSETILHQHISDPCSRQIAVQYLRHDPLRARLYCNSESA